MDWRQPCVYILTSKPRGTLYIGITSNLIKRVWQHKTYAAEGFSSRHHVHSLIWYEMHETMESAILREKRLKEWKRVWKIRLIEERNPDWLDLYPYIC
jgi:putative endonuclease